jgi:hypothetical protein
MIRVLLLIVLLAMTLTSESQITATWQNATTLRITWQNAPSDARIAVNGQDIGNGSSGTVDVLLPNPPIGGYVTIYQTNAPWRPYLLRVLIPKQPIIVILPLIVQQT